MPVDDRRVGGAGHLRVRDQRAGEPAVLQQQRLELLQVDVLASTSSARRRALALQRERAARRRATGRR